MPEVSKKYFATYHLHYNKILSITEYVYKPFLFWPLSKQLLYLDALFDCNIKFNTYHLYYKKKL